MAKAKKVPAIRFKGFDDEWVYRKFLNNIDKIIDFRGRTPKKLGLDWSPTGYLALSALNVKNGFIDFTIDSHYGNQELYDTWMKGNELHKGQVIFTTEAPMGNVAQIPDNKCYILSQRAIAFEVNKTLLTENFLLIILCSPKVFNNLTALCSGGTAKGVSQKSLAELFISLPIKLTEQSKIGTFFFSLDCLITKHQQKHDKLTTLKKAMLEKMFPQNGALIPEIRFKGFTEEWEEKKLGDLKDIRDGTHDSPKYGCKGYPLVTSKNLSPYGLDLSNVSKISENDFNKINKRSKVDIGDIIFGMIGTIGNPIIVFNNNFAIKNVALIKIGGNISNLFLIHLLKSQIFNTYIQNEHSGSTQTFLSLSKIREFLLYIPDLKEQQKIGHYFSNLDNLISLEQKQIDTLKNIKKACLEKMFV